MGGDVAQRTEWNHDSSVHWDLLEHDSHRGVLTLLGDLGRLYQSEPALYELDCEPEGYEWLEGGDWQHSMLAFLRRDRAGNAIVCVFNFTPVQRSEYRVGVPHAGSWMEIFNSDADRYWGSGLHGTGTVEADAIPWHGRECSIAVDVPPLAAVYFKP
jgi:1,4-alpha-glucan branching enzyme